eukprot:scaffold20254_cov134-Isochrysis_galbana.AAC.2
MRPPAALRHRCPSPRRRRPSDRRQSRLPSPRHTRCSRHRRPRRPRPRCPPRRLPSRTRRALLLTLHQLPNRPPLRRRRSVPANRARRHIRQSRWRTFRLRLCGLKCQKCRRSSTWTPGPNEKAVASEELGWAWSPARTGSTLGLQRCVFRWAHGTHASSTAMCCPFLHLPGLRGPVWCGDLGDHERSALVIVGEGPGG